jgi:hypothetical protein
MCANGRPPDPHFHPEEFLFRRIPILLWDQPGEPLSVDAVKLPDISVGRSKYGHAEWARFDCVHGNHYEDWGVVAVQVQDIPGEQWKEGVFHFTFQACHAPSEKDYSHSEIRAFENSEHVDAVERLPEDIHLLWRARLLRKMKSVIKPYQKVAIRENPPVSHKLEPFQTLP